MYYDAIPINFVTWELSRVTDVHLNDVGVGESCQQLYLPGDPAHLIIINPTVLKNTALPQKLYNHLEHVCMRHVITCVSI